MEECLELEPRAEMVAEGRRFVARVVGAWELAQFSDESMLVTSELLGNSVLHARSDIRLTISSEDGSGVRIEVFDHNSRMPMVAACPADATSGRGLALVEALSSRWGTESHPDGKVVWAELGRRAESPDRDCLDLRESATVDQALGPGRRLASH